MVHYQGTRFRPRLGLDHQLLAPVEFLALLVPHVPLKYEITLRLYGALSTTFRRTRPSSTTSSARSIPSPRTTTRRPDLPRPVRPLAKCSMLETPRNGGSGISTSRSPR